MNCRIIALIWFIPECSLYFFSVRQFEDTNQTDTRQIWCIKVWFFFVLFVCFYFHCSFINSPLPGICEFFSFLIICVCRPTRPLFSASGLCLCTCGCSRYYIKLLWSLQIMSSICVLCDATKGGGVGQYASLRKWNLWKHETTGLWQRVRSHVQKTEALNIWIGLTVRVWSERDRNRLWENGGTVTETWWQP